MPFVYKPPVLAAAVLCFLAVMAASPASAGGQLPAGVDLIQIAARPTADGAPPPVVDGKVNDESWIGVEPYTNFIQTDPIEGAPASERTEVRVLFGKAHLYIGVIASTPSPARSSSPRAGAMPTSPSRTRSSSSSTPSTTTRTRSCSAPIRSASSTTARWRAKARPAASRRPVGGDAAASQRGGISAFNPNWDGDWTVKSRRSPSAAGKPRWRSRSRRCAIRPAPTRPGASTSCATSATRTSRSTWRRSRAASTSTASRWRRS